MTDRRFPPPWTVEQIAAGFKVLDATGQSLAYFYGHATRAEADTAKGLTMDEARRLASNFAKLPELLGKGEVTMQDEFIIGEHEAIKRFSDAQGWRECGRATWLRPDRGTVHYLHFPEQLTALPAGSTLHVVGFSEIAEAAEMLDYLTLVPHE